MTIAKTMLASAAAFGLAAAPIAAQASPVRSATDITKSSPIRSATLVSHGQHLAGGNGAVYVAVAAFAIAIAIILATTDNGHGRPASPG